MLDYKVKLTQKEIDILVCILREVEGYPYKSLCKDTDRLQHKLEPLSSPEGTEFVDARIDGASNIRFNELDAYPELWIKLK